MLSWQVREFLSFIPMSLRIALANRADGRLREQRVQFGSHPRQHLLTFDPDPAAPARDSFVLFVHGGGWNMGRPDNFRFIGRFFARLGFPTLLAGYRLTPKHRFPSQLEDVIGALAWALKSGWTGALGRKVIAVGQSSGAQLAALAVYNRAELARQEMDQSIFSGLVSISGPLDFSACKQMAGHKLVADYLGHLSRWEVADPMHHVDGSEKVPVLCLHGDRDPLVELESSVSFAPTGKPRWGGLGPGRGAARYPPRGGDQHLSAGSVRGEDSEEVAGGYERRVVSKSGRRS